MRKYWKRFIFSCYPVYLFFVGITILLCVLVLISLTPTALITGDSVIELWKDAGWGSIPVVASYNHYKREKEHIK